MTQDNISSSEPELVLVFSASFYDGALMSKDAFVLFLKIADKRELAQCQYQFLSAIEAAHTKYPYYDSLAVKEELLGSYHVH